MTDTIEVMSSTEAAGGSSAGRPLNELAAELLARADADGVCLVGPGGLLSGLTKTVLEAALEAEMTEHLGYEAHDPAGHHSGNNRNGSRSKTVLTDIGPVELEVPATATGASRRSSWRSGRGVCRGWTPWCVRCPRKVSLMARLAPIWPRSWGSGVERDGQQDH